MLRNSLLLTAAIFGLVTTPAFAMGHNPTEPDHCTSGCQGGESEPSIPTQVPEPGMLGIAAIGLAGLILGRRTNRSSRQK
ncbi:PEP-CTERM sorting domain-containing protein [Altericroceibacterium endophyticum]|uniref:PEP-CTERM sorting domain-containing protein n=1 Tax=Altericroceibacterium endophyticum TaxID=1808508 RepID=A0A6I4T0K5_9SPHN|nr:PEP-CTERM sorting domain-containing protein [Altericroceibacterium endophyticum]